MRFTMNRDALSHAAQVAGRVASHGTTPAMACVLIEAGEEGCSFSATDGDQHVRHSDVALVEEPGECMVSAQALGKAVRSLKDGAVCVSSERGSVSVECAGSRFTLPSLGAGEWMGAPYSPEGPSCRIDAAALQVMCKRVAPFCDAGKGAREMLKGIHLVFDGELKMEASDSYRIAICGQPAEGDPIDCNVPKDFMLRAAESMEGEVEISSDGNRVLFSCGSTQMGARCIALKFPDVGRMLAKSREGMTVGRDSLLGMLNRATQLGNGKFGMSLDSDGREVTAHAEVGEVGSFSESCPCEGAFSTYADSQFLKSCVEAMDAGEVEVVSDGPRSPVCFLGDFAVTMVLPMHRKGEA